ncbi:MAG: DUF6478 family protein [Paracoccus hibiscisoli]|uniref:DUF6478 family protein n=1 Tax=Paracoccus hibiscisoli TaxID=2023261 RepID=UPI00391CF9D6
MSRLEQGWLSRRLRARVTRQWQRLMATTLRGTGPVRQDLRDEARALHQVLSRLLQAADARAMGARDSLSRIELPAGTDWRWRPQVLRARHPDPALIAPPDGKWLSEEIALFHDCPERALILRQLRNRRATDLSEYGLALEVMGFAGSFLSFSLTLPPDALADLGGHHIVRLDAVMQAERPITVYARLNVQQGPNTENLLRKMGDPIHGRHCDRTVEFDLGYSQLSSRTVDKVWLDLIFEAPFMNAVVLRDVILSRHPRAQI